MSRIFLVLLGLIIPIGLAAKDVPDGSLSTKQVQQNRQYLNSYVTQDRCPSKDNRDHFGPFRDQDGVGLCWSFAATALLEEELCLKDRSKCGKSLSPLDASRCTWSLEKYSLLGLVKKTEGGWPSDALSCGLSGGVCDEELAPYSGSTNFQCTLHQKIILEDKAQCLIQNLGADYEQLHLLCPACGTGKESLSSTEAKWLSELNLRIIQESNRRFTDMDILKLAASSKTKSEFLQKVLLPPACSANREAVSKSNFTSVVHLDQTKKPKDYWDGIVDALKTGHSAAIGVCLDKVGSEVGLSPKVIRVIQILGSVVSYVQTKAIPQHPVDEAFGCAGHAVVVDGMYWDDSTKSCQIHIRNSWGTDAQDEIFNGWLPALPVTSAVMDVTYLKEK